jgi:hypothetical protein
MRLGDRVKTKGFGEGTVVGFEHFTPAGHAVIESRPRNERTRVLVALDNPKAWICANERNPHPYMMGSDFLEPMAVPRVPKPALAPFVQMKPPTPLPELEADPYERIHDTLYIVARRMAILAMFVFICLLYLR